MRIIVVGKTPLGISTARRLAAREHEICLLEPAELPTLEGTAGVIFVCIETSLPTGGVDFDGVQDLFLKLGDLLGSQEGYHLIVIRSPLVPGITEEHLIPTLERASGRKAGDDFGVCIYPEFRSPRELQAGAQGRRQILIGQMDEPSGTLLRSLLAEPDPPMNMTSLSAAEYSGYLYRYLKLDPQEYEIPTPVFEWF